MVRAVAHKKPPSQHRSFKPFHHPLPRKEAVLILRAFLARPFGPVYKVIDHRGTVLIYRYEAYGSVLVLLGAMIAQESGQIEEPTDGIFHFLLQSVFGGIRLRFRRNRAIPWRTGVRLPVFMHGVIILYIKR
jgi:hypothetical protein